MKLNFYPTNGCNSYTGYGKLELGLARGLQDAGVQLTIAPDDDVPVLIVGNAGWLKAPHVKGLRKWLFTMSESDKISEEWVATINMYAERVLVPAPALVGYYRDSGVDVPVHYAGMGVDVAPFVKQTPPLAPPRAGVDTQQSQGGESESGVFTFLTYSYGDMRKGAELAMFAFKRAFGGDSDYQMVVKARDGHDRTWLAGLKDEQITVIGGAQDEAGWYNLLMSADCFVFPSRGEGFGLPPREAVLLGVPAIATAWLGMWDVAEWGLPVRVKDMRLTRFDSYEANHRKGRWAEPDDLHLEQQMRWVAQNHSEARGIAEKGRRYLLANNTWATVAGRIVSLLVEAG